MVNQSKSKLFEKIDCFFKKYCYKCIISFKSVPTSKIPCIEVDSITVPSGVFKKYCEKNNLQLFSFSGHTKILGADNFETLVKYCVALNVYVYPKVGQKLEQSITIKKGLTPIKIGNSFGLFQQNLDAIPKKGFIEIPRDFILEQNTVLTQQWVNILMLLKLKCKKIDSKIIAVFKGIDTLPLDHLQLLDSDYSVIAERFRALHSKICTKSNIQMHYVKWIHNIINKYHQIDKL